MKIPGRLYVQWREHKLSDKDSPCFEAQLYHLPAYAPIKFLTESDQ